MTGNIPRSFRRIVIGAAGRAVSVGSCDVFDASRADGAAEISEPTREPGPPIGIGKHVDHICGIEDMSPCDLPAPVSTLSGGEVSLWREDPRVWMPLPYARECSLFAPGALYCVRSDQGNARYNAD